jgi:hypothetical protein
MVMIVNITIGRDSGVAGPLVGSVVREAVVVSTAAGVIRSAGTGRLTCPAAGRPAVPSHRTRGGRRLP